MPQLRNIPKAGATLCVNCHHVFDVVEAYKNTRIAYGAVEMDRLTAEEWRIVNNIKAERDKAKGRAGPRELDVRPGKGPRAQAA